MTGLKSFIVTEELRAEHAERLFIYQERYHEQIILDLRTLLEKAWQKEINSFTKKHPPTEESIEDAVLRNPKASTALVIDSIPETILTARHRDPLSVAPSVKIPFVYTKEHRILITKKLMVAADDSFKDLTERWREIFKLEDKGRTTPWFKITKDSDEVRFQLAVSSSSQEHYKTLYSVRIEFGKVNSKLKDHDRVYLVVLA